MRRIYGHKNIAGQENGYQAVWIYSEAEVDNLYTKVVSPISNNPGLSLKAD
jgi:hypothetical protein